MAIAALRVAASQPGGEASTTLLKEEIPKYVNLTDGDREMSDKRPREQMWQQIVGNIVSHRRSNIIREGYAEYTGDGIRITEAGHAHLKSLGF